VAAITGLATSTLRTFARRLGASWAGSAEEVARAAWTLRSYSRAARSVANLTRRDAEEFLALAPRVPVHTEVTAFPLDQANEALACLRAGASPGSIVLAVS
jgi:D-arabinose 1-dehydrogenase-like Zn-dependent alcohol dehydrogenase